MAGGTTSPGSRRPGRGVLTAVLLAVTGVVVALTVVVATRPFGGPRPPPPPPPVNEQEQVLSMTSRLLATAQQLGAGQPKARAAAWEQARELMDAYVRIHPQDAKVRLRLAEVLVLLGRHDQAAGQVEAVLALRPGSAQALWMKGLLLRQRGADGHEEYLRQAADSPDADAKIWSLYGLEMAAKGQVDTAERYLQKARQAGANDPATLCELARIALGRNHFAQAEGYLEQAVRHGQAGPTAWAMLAEVQKETGRLDEAAESVAEAIRRLPRAAEPGADPGPDKGDLLALLGQVRLLQQRHAEAAAAFAEASDYPLVAGPAALNAAKCYYFLGRHALAMKYIDLAVERMPGQAQVAEWVRRIEDARFGPPASAPSPATMSRGD